MITFSVFALIILSNKRKEEGNWLFAVTKIEAFNSVFDITHKKTYQFLHQATKPSKVKKKLLKSLRSY